jgi:hypothetical protein
MASESDENLRLEIRHVLFIDLVGYSKLLIEEQKARLNKLTEVVLATPQVAETSNEQLVRLPTGDGVALVFRNSAEEPAQCALEIAQALKAHPEVAVRMGIHSGPVSEVTDVSGRPNITGGGMNMAQRVMDCGDAGHILLSKNVERRAASVHRQTRQGYALLGGGSLCATPPAGQNVRVARDCLYSSRCCAFETIHFSFPHGLPRRSTLRRLLPEAWDRKPAAQAMKDW